MTPKTCPRCGQAATGNFCATCGAAIAAKACPACGAEPEPGSRFCTRCGSPLAAGGPGPAPAGAPVAAPGSGGADSNLGWWAAGGLMVVLILVVAWPILRGEPASPTGPTGPTAPVASGGAATGPSSVDLSSMTPREAADRLYLRVVRTAAAGDTAGAVGFVPMTVAAFDQARPLDADGLFHLTQVHSVAGDHASMLAAAEEALADSPNHLLNLHAAGTAAADLGDTVRALEHYRRLLEVWDEEMASGNADYESHALMMDEARSSAEAYVAANGG